MIARTSKFRIAANSTVRFIGLAAATGALAACGGADRPRADLAAAQVNTIGVNSFLWRASLETVSFAPLLQADSAVKLLKADHGSMRLCKRPQCKN